MVDDDPPGPDFKEVQAAPPDNEPDDTLRIGGVERHQPLTGTFEDRLPCVCKRSGHGIVNGPGLPCGSVQKPERPGISLCKQEPRQE